MPCGQPGGPLRDRKRCLSGAERKMAVRSDVSDSPSPFGAQSEPVRAGAVSPGGAVVHRSGRSRPASAFTRTGILDPAGWRLGPRQMGVAASPTGARCHGATAPAKVHCATGMATRPEGARPRSAGVDLWNDSGYGLAIQRHCLTRASSYPRRPVTCRCRVMDR